MDESAVPDEVADDGAGITVAIGLPTDALVYYVRRPDFTYFVDGAIYGFAAGVGFAVVENLLYLRNATGAGDGLTLTIICARERPGNLYWSTI